MIESVPGESRENVPRAAQRAAQLSAAISQAARGRNYEEVAILEAELSALQKGERFDREEFVRNKSKIKIPSQHAVLREMQNLPNHDGEWTWEGFARTWDRERSYENTFRDILSQIGVKSFQKLTDQRARELGRNVRVLDLFGGAYFLDDLTPVSEIMGVRLTNIDGQVRNDYQRDGNLLGIVDSPKRSVLEGNLYTGDTWRKIKDKNKTGYDLIVCRPEGPFQNSSFENIESVEDGGMQREKIFISLLERALNLLSPEGGMLFTQMPALGTDRSTARQFWQEYIAKKGNYKFFFGPGRSHPERAFAVQRIQ